MNLVQPIRDREKLEEMKEELKKNGIRNYLLFLTGINTGLRISDLVKLNRNDVRNKDNSMKQHITIVEKKTNKIKKFPSVNSYSRPLYCHLMRPNDPTGTLSTNWNTQ